MSLWPTRPSFYGDQGSAGDEKEPAVVIPNTYADLQGFYEGEVLVSATIEDLGAGSGLNFEDRGSHELKGFPNFAEPPVLAAR
jgi:hypothetical protein